MVFLFKNRDPTAVNAINFYPSNNARGWKRVTQSTHFKVKGLREQAFTAQTYEYIKEYAEKLNSYKEKTAFFIKH